jgi:hypothetical protein
MRRWTQLDGIQSRGGSQQIPLASVGDAPLKSGFVENIHPNGPIVYAHEQYVVNGATPTTSYQVTILVFLTDTSCASTPLAIPTATLETTPNGNGVAEVVFTPEDADALRGASHGAIWQLSVDDTVVYQTACSVIVLD